jgi:hypothetical protein
MIRKFTLKTFLATAVGALALIGAQGALADTVTSADGTFSASASLTCSSDPCITGSTVTATGSATNLGRGARKATATITILDASGNVIYSSSSSYAVGPNKTIEKSESLLVTDSLARGDYTLTVAIDGISASSTLTIS